MNPKVVQELLGHEIAITLDLYGHVLPSMGREVAVLVGRSLITNETRGPWLIRETRPIVLCVAVAMLAGATQLQLAGQPQTR